MAGGYAAAVPLDLPAARGGLPVPLQIVSGGRGVGAAGLGWDVPLSYVRRDTSVAHRRPIMHGDSEPVGREQVSLAFQGQQFDLVRKGPAWVPRRAAPEISVREQHGRWVLFDGQGRTYTFVTPTALAGTNVWLLSTVSGAGGLQMQLDYDITKPTLIGGSGIAIDLVHIRYNYHPTPGFAKHEVVLTYDAATTTPLALSMLGNYVLARMRTLKWVDVTSRTSSGDAPERLRRYELLYAPDADTQQPRLQSVRMWGRQGTPEADIAVPIASYTYGTATTGPANAPTLRYQKTQTIALPAAVDHTYISRTHEDSTVHVPGCPTCADVKYATWQNLIDVTGDGRPDFVFPQNGQLWVARNAPGPGGTTTLDVGPIAPLVDPTLASGLCSAKIEAAGISA
jgi:hypothetical protein